MLFNIIKDKINVLMVSETKKDSTFPNTQFVTEGYAQQYRHYEKYKSGGIILHVRRYSLKINQLFIIKRY